MLEIPHLGGVILSLETAIALGASGGWNREQINTPIISFLSTGLQDISSTNCPWGLHTRQILICHVGNRQSQTPQQREVLQMTLYS